MKRAKRIKFNRKPVIAALSIVATSLPLLSSTKVQAYDYTKEQIENMFATSDGGYWYQHDFDTNAHWDGTVLTPEAVAQNIAEHDQFSKHPKPEENQKPINSVHIFKLKGNVTVSLTNSSYVGLFSFTNDGQIGTVKNRGLANGTAWFTDQYRVYNGKRYYRVATDEWVIDSNVINFVAK